MFGKIYNFWQLLKSNLWFTPAVFCIAYAAFVLILHHLETTYFVEAKLSPVFFDGDINDAKTVMNALVPSMITMATLTISITVVVLSFAASQLGPRLIKTFLSDARTKYFIGYFFGAVSACFVMIFILHESGSDYHVPKATLTAVFAICFINLFALLGFVHHIAHSCIADTIIMNVSSSLEEAIDRLSPRNAEKPIRETLWPVDFDQKKTSLIFEQSGYIQYIDYEELVALADEHDLHLHILFKAGHFLIEGENGMEIYPYDHLNAEVRCALRDAFVIGAQRTSTQDLEYSVRHLVEIAIRALSPGINDSFTAISVINHLAAALSRLFQSRMHDADIPNEAGIVRVRTRQNTESDLIFSAFDQIRHSGKSIPAILRHLLEKIEALAGVAQTDIQKQGLLQQVKQIRIDCAPLNDAADLPARAKTLEEKLKADLEEA